MATTQTKTETTLRNMLYLTDFSGASEAALSFAITLGRGCGAKVHALHVLCLHGTLSWDLD
jgi:nucleotide-binding universal stress UspA family protein